MQWLRGTGHSQVVICYGLNCVLSKTCWGTNPQYSECDLNWNQGLYRCNQIKMRSLEWVLIQYDWCPYKNRDRCRLRKGKEGEVGGRDWSDTSLSQGTPRIVDSHQNLVGENWTPLSLQGEPTLLACLFVFFFNDLKDQRLTAFFFFN